MKFIFGQNAAFWEVLSYDGIIGIAYDGLGWGMLSILIFAVCVALCLVGLVTVLKWGFSAIKKKIKSKAKK